MLGFNCLFNGLFASHGQRHAMAAPLQALGLDQLDPRAELPWGRPNVSHLQAQGLPGD
jgi:hypothetical protein